MAIQFKDGKILFVDGQIAMDPACCCGCVCDNGDLPATVTIDGTLNLYDENDTLRETQVWSAILSLNASLCIYSGGISRSITDYDEVGVQCDSRSAGGSATLTWESGPQGCGWYLYQYNNGYVFFDQHDPRGTWDSYISDTEYLLNVWQCGDQGTDFFYAIFTSFVVS